MAARTDYPETPAERLISWTIQATWLLWIVGGLYIAGPVLGWTLAAMAARDLYLAPGRPEEDRPALPGAIVLVWMAGMLAMLIILLIGHSVNDLGPAQTLKSAVGWAKGWALLAVFPFAGAVLKVRAEVVYRAICRLGLQTLILLPCFLAAPFLGLPQLLYVSPLQIFGGSSSEFFAVILYTFEPGSGIPRWQFFAPWSPAAGMVAVVHILAALEERSMRWKGIGIIAGLAVAVLSESRLALVALVVIWPITQLVAKLNRPVTWFAAAPVALTLGLLGNEVLALEDRISSSFSGARAASSRVRSILGRIALERWQGEAPLFGHGVVERGPHLVEFMPIGSHHTWYGLLFVKGITGLVALALPLLYSLIACGRLAMHDKAGRIGFSMLLVLALYSFGENLEALSYLIWPALILVGVADRHAAFPAAPQPGPTRKMSCSWFADVCAA